MPTLPKHDHDTETLAEDQAPEFESTSSRRNVLKVGVGVVGAGLACGVAVPAASFLAFPLDHEVTSSGDAYVAVGRRDQFGEIPKKVDIYSDRVDAWNRVSEVKIGSAWVVEQEGKLVAFSTRCPHLGCAIDWDLEESRFACPCHDSSFSARGHREHGPSPRDMDTLQLEQEDELVQIRYQRYKQGSQSKEPIG